MIKIFLVVALSAVAFGSSKDIYCRCRPHESCWPSVEQWYALNKTINGHLVAVRPAASVCRGDGFDTESCKTATALWTDSVWRSSQPGAMQWQNWEAWPEHHQTCYIESPRNTACDQGRISLYSARVQTASHIQSSVRFAKTHNLRLVIKNTGHDFLGRSTAPESLQIMTHDMKNIHLAEHFLPRGAPKSKHEGPAVTIEAGVQLPEMYAAVARHNRTVLGGSAHTVGAAGGYIQGGGHSPFGAWKGLASDHALEFEVVTATGTLVTANAYQNTDLFWALRGGGGGTFGVVVSVTVRTFAEVPVVAYNLNITTAANNPRFWDAFAQFHAALPSLNDAGGSGYYYTLPNVSLSANTSVSTLISLLVFPEKTNLAEVDKSYQSLTAILEDITGIKTQNTSIPFPTMNSTISTLLFGGSKADPAGDVSLLASRLYSKDLLTSKDGPFRLAKAWKSIRMDPNGAIVGHVVAGGAAAANGDKVDSAVNPAWRKAVTHMLFRRSWNANATLEEQRAILSNMTEVEIPVLRSVEGARHMGAYLNEACPYEPGFQASFWGDNYPRLYQIKQKWDPSGLFITRKGVGSEDWDDAGLCMVSRDPSQIFGVRDGYILESELRCNLWPCSLGHDSLSGCGRGLS